MSRIEQRRDTITRVRQAAATLFATQGYGPTTISAIAQSAGVSVGTVTSVGSKDALFLEATEQMATSQALGILEQAREHADVTERLRAAMLPLVESAANDVDFLRDYFIANLRSTMREPNSQRVSMVIMEIAHLWDVDARECSEHAIVTAGVLYSVYTTICLGLASGASSLVQGQLAMEAAIGLLRSRELSS